MTSSGSSQFMVGLCPPKPKELDMAAVTFTFFDLPRTQSMSPMTSSGSSQFMVGCSSPCSSAFRQATASSPPRRPEGVPDHGLGPVHVQTLPGGSGREHLLHRQDLSHVPRRSGGSVAVDVVHLLPLGDARVLEGELDAPRDAEAVLSRLGHVVGVAVDATAEVLRDDGGPSLHGVLEALHDEHTRALAHDEPVALLVPRARRGLKLLVIRGEGAAGDEAPDAGGDDGRLNAPPPR